MIRDQSSRRARTLRNIDVCAVTYSKDDSVNSESRSLEVVNLIVQMIGLSHKRGRTKNSNGEEDVS